MNRKKYKLNSEQIRPLVPGRGACFATDKITVEGCRVGYMYREEPDNDADSGWRFMSGDEDDTYMSDVDNQGVYEVNTIANYDPEIIPYLDSPVGSVYQREVVTGRLVESSRSAPN